MIYIKRLQTGEILEFGSIDSVGDSYFNTSLYVQIRGAEIDQYLLDKARNIKLKQLLSKKDFKINDLKVECQGHIYESNDSSKTLAFIIMAIYNKVMNNGLSSSWKTANGEIKTFSNEKSMEMIGQVQNYYFNERPALYQNLLDQINNATTIDEINAIAINL